MLSYTWEIAAQRWLDERRHKVTVAEDRAKLVWLRPHFDDRPLADVDQRLIAAVARLKADETSAATANRYLALVRAILRRACLVWEWIVKVPPIELYPEHQRRVRWLSHHQARVLLGELPLHQRHAVLFALATGLRQGNVLGLEWDQLDIPRRLAWIHADQAKARRVIRVPLSAVALQVLDACYGRHPRYVFTYRGRHLCSANTRAWQRALARSGIDSFRWHDLRHTWASWHAQEGTPLYVLQDLGGWSSEAMVRRYAHLAPHQYAQHAETVSQLLLNLPHGPDF